jgi:predicted branched-subunit amino acid permease
MAGNRQHIIHGLRDGIPIAMGYFAVTFSLGIIAAWFRLGLFPVAAICCVIVYLLI